MDGSVLGCLVHAGSGEPIARATIVAGEAAPAGTARGDIPRPAPAVLAVTGVDGWFLFERLRRGAWLLRARSTSGETIAQAVVHVFDDALSELTLEAGVSPGLRVRRPARRPGHGPGRGPARGSKGER